LKKERFSSGCWRFGFVEETGARWTVTRCIVETYNEGLWNLAENNRWKVSTVCIWSSGLEKYAFSIYCPPCRIQAQTKSWKFYPYKWYIYTPTYKKRLAIKNKTIPAFKESDNN
jgi:hypothetical protein